MLSLAPMVARSPCTELFFLDEPTAFAAGHRPCFECRRKDAEAFAEKWREARRLSSPPYAAEMDEVLHADFQLPTISAPTVAPSAMSVRRDSPRHMTELPGGGSLARAR